MSVLVDRDTRVVVQGITGHQGTVHAREMRLFGTSVVAGVTPGKAGTEVEGVPVFDSVRDAVEATHANASSIFVPAPYARDALLEAVDAGIRLCVVVTEHIPFHDMLVMYHYARSKGTRIIGPNCPGIASPGASKVGIIPNVVFRPGRIGVISRSGTLTTRSSAGSRRPASASPRASASGETRSSGPRSSTPCPSSKPTPTRMPS